MRISDWSSDVCSSDLPHFAREGRRSLIRPLAKRLNELLILSESIIHESLVSKIATDVRFAILLLQCSNHANINATSWIGKKSYRSLKPAPSGWAFRCRVSAKMLAFIRRPSEDGRRMKEIPIQWAQQSHIGRSWSRIYFAW